MEVGELYTHTFKGEWEEVVELYKAKPEVWRAKITSSGDTALHMVINEDNEDVVATLVHIIDSADDQHDGEKAEALTKANVIGDTPLHRAAARGSVEMCECIVKTATKYMAVEDFLTITNEWGENPIFVAVLDNRKHAFIFLLQAADKSEDKLLRSSISGDTILHSAISREHYDLAFHIMKVCPDLVGKCNVEGLTPLHILATKPSAFSSGHHLSWWQAIIYHCIRVDPLEYDDFIPERTVPLGRSAIEHPKNYRTCYQFFSSLRCGVGDPENHYTHHVKGNVPQNYATWFQFLFMVLHNLFGVIGYGNIFDEIIKARRKHTWSAQILDEMLKNPAEAYVNKPGSRPGLLEDFGDLVVLPGNAELPYRVKKSTQGETSGDESQKKSETALLAQKGIVLVNKILERLDSMAGKTNEYESQGNIDTALLVAAQKGVVEVVNKILERLPVSIHDTSSNKKNIVLVAVENRQPRILKALYKHLVENLMKPRLWHDLIRAVDADDNNVLHLAAKYELPIQGSSALQMQHELKWYEYVKSLIPTHYTFLTNKERKNPLEIFLAHHKDLFERSDEWLSRTSESCSVVAALVASVAYATSSTVPGGNDDKTGKPTLEGHLGFDIFAVTALMALCFSVTALILFLSILTCRKKPADFMTKLPVKLFLALSSLFVSILSMFVSFCAAHSFVLEDKFGKAVLPLYVVVCLPVSFTILEFPLYMDLFRGIFMKV